MRIKQSIVLYNFFRKSFMNKYNLIGYNNIEKPVILRGCRRKNYILLQEHKGIAIIIWAGSDAIGIYNDKEKLRFFNNNNNRIFHIAISNFICNDLKKAGLDYEYIPITPFTYEGFIPCPLGNSVYVYIPHTKPEFYGKSLVEQVQKKLPGINFIICNTSTYSRDQLIYVYKKCFIALRLTPHDGLSNTVVEMGMMGRRVIWNGDTPNAIPYNNINDIINIIEQERIVNTSPTEVYKRMTNFLDIGDDWLNTEFYTNKNSIRTNIRHTATVIINTYKEDKDNLIAAIESYKNQIDVDVEIIISTVKGDAAIDIGKKYGCTICISNKKGIYTQLNKAIGLIKNDWYCYASGNDTAMPNKIISEIRCCLESDKLICYSNYIRYDSDNESIRTVKFREYDYSVHLTKNFVSDCALIHKSIINEYAPFDVKWGNSAYHDFWLRVFATEGDIFCFNNIATWNYIIRASSNHKIRKKDNRLFTKENNLRDEMLQYHKSKNILLRHYNISRPFINIHQNDIGDNRRLIVNNPIVENKHISSEKQNKRRAYELAKRLKNRRKEDKQIVMQTPKIEHRTIKAKPMLRKKEAYESKPINGGKKIILYKSTKETHFVYPWVNSDDNAKDDLINSIKSIRKFFKGNTKIFVIGDKCNIHKTTNIVLPQIKKGKFSKALDIANKISYIIQSVDIEDNFIYMYDDIIFLKDIDYDTLNRVIATERVERYESYFNGSRDKPHPNWLELFNKTFELLIDNKLPLWNYETHLPRVFNKELLSLIINRFNLLNEPYLISTIYYNYFNVAPYYSLRYDIPDFKFGVYAPHDELIIKRGIKNATILSYNDTGLNSILKRKIRGILR